MSRPAPDSSASPWPGSSASMSRPARSMTVSAYRSRRQSCKACRLTRPPANRQSPLNNTVRPAVRASTTTCLLQWPGAATISTSRRPARPGADGPNRRGGEPVVAGIDAGRAGDTQRGAYLVGGLQCRRGFGAAEHGQPGRVRCRGAAGMVGVVVRDHHAGEPVRVADLGHRGQPCAGGQTGAGVHEDPAAVVVPDQVAVAVQVVGQPGAADPPHRVEQLFGRHVSRRGARPPRRPQRGCWPGRRRPSCVPGRAR